MFAFFIWLEMHQLTDLNIFFILSSSSPPPPIRGPFCFGWEAKWMSNLLASAQRKNLGGQCHKINPPFWFILWKLKCFPLNAMFFPTSPAVKPVLRKGLTAGVLLHAVQTALQPLSGICPRIPHVSTSGQHPMKSKICQWFLASYWIGPCVRSGLHECSIYYIV